MLSYQQLIEETDLGVLHFGGARMALLEIEAGFWGLRRQLEALVGRRLTNSVLQQAGANGGASFARAFAVDSPHTEGAILAALHDCVAAYQAAGFGHFTIEDAQWPPGRVRLRGENTFEAWMFARHETVTSGPICAYSAGVLVGFINALAGRRDIVCTEVTCQAQGAEVCLFELLPAAEAGAEPVIAFDPDPFLSQQLNLLDLLFTRMPMGIVIFDRDLHIRRFNPTWAEYIGRYTPSDTGQVLPGARLFDLAPGSEKTLAPILERVLAGETVAQDALPSESGGILSYWDVVFTPLYENGEVVGILDVVTDATERVRIYQNLESLVEERTRQLQTLLQISHNVASTLELDRLLDQILEQLYEVVDYTGATILTLDGDNLVVMAHRGPIPQENLGRLRFPFDQAASRHTILEQETLIVPDVRADTPLARAYRQSGGHKMASTFAYVRSWMAVPLVVKDQVIGILSLDHSEPGFYTEHNAELARAFANQVAVSIENAQLYQGEQRRRAESERQRQAAESLRGILQVLNSDQSLPEVLDTIARQAGQLMEPGTAVALFSFDENYTIASLEAHYRLPKELAQTDYLPATFVGGPDLLAGNPLVIQDTGPYADQLLPLATTPESRAAIKIFRAHFRSYLAVPLVVREVVYGGIAFHFSEARQIGDEELDLALTLSDQAALAIENARLRETVERSAVIEERNRLARELHDAVTQTLFSASLIADVLPRIWEKNPDEGRRRLEELRELTRGALAEMRAMLLELRPASLAEYTLADLLNQLAAAHTGRARLPVKVDVAGEEQPLPIDVQVALYRIAQEALNNVAKHAGDCQVRVLLRYEPQQVILVIDDDGRGFAVGDVPANSLGLGIMGERAGKIRANLAVESQPGAGTHIRVTWPFESKREK